MGWWGGRGGGGRGGGGGGRRRGGRGGGAPPPGGPHHRGGRGGRGARGGDAVATDSTCAGVRPTRVLMLPVISACAPEQPGCPLSVALPTVSKTATCEPGWTAPATTSGRQKLTVSAIIPGGIAR